MNMISRMIKTRFAAQAYIIKCDSSMTKWLIQNLKQTTQQEIHLTRNHLNRYYKSNSGHKTESSFVICVLFTVSPSRVVTVAIQAV